MGQGASSASSLRLEDASVEALAGGIEALGPKYKAYSAAVRGNAVDGGLLASLDDASFQETLEDLDVNSRLHQRVLTKEWVKWKERDYLHSTLAPKGPSPTPAPSTAAAGPRRRTCSNKDMARIFAKDHPEYVQNHQVTISEEERQALIEAAASYGLTEATPDSELEGFDRTACKAFELCHASYGGVHILEEDGHFVLAARFRSNHNGVQEIRKDRIHAPIELSRCYGAIVCSDNDLIIEKLEAGKSPFQSSQQSSSFYLAHVLRTPDGKRIGVVCIEQGDDEDRQDCHDILNELAAEAEAQLRVRKALLTRREALRDQIHQLNLRREVLPAHGPLRAITQDELDRRGPPPYPMPDEIAASGKPRHTSTLPFAQQNRASPAEMSHLPDDFYQAADEFGAEYTPVPKDDMQRVAVLESLGLTELTHDSATGIALKRLVVLGARLFDVSYAEISFQTHDQSYTFARYVTCTDEQKAAIFAFYNTINVDDTGEPWLMAFPTNSRCLNLCSYVLTSKRTMAVHDVWSDESFKWARKHDVFQFYCGSPIVVNGHVVATLCMMDFRVRPDFSQAQEMQQEQIAMLISQRIESWALRRDVERLEKERRRLEAPLLKASPPDRSATLVFTDVQGSTSLWEANPHAMNEAIALHDLIMRKIIKGNHGFEVATEGDAFHVAFHDSIDAACFALEAQKPLNDAEWSDDLLSLPEALNDGNGFRGLRVRIAIHAGDVISRDNEVSGRREFTGPTYYIGKSLEGMAHGGQVLITSDAWNTASHLSESLLGSPQVLDLGLHVLLKGKTKTEGIIAKRVLQLVPSALSYDYTQRRTVDDKSTDGSAATGVFGRCFPPVRSHRRLSASFHDAPYANNQATMAFVCTKQIEDLLEDPSTILAMLSKRIGILLTDQPGYQCKDFMLVFSSTAQAISFGLKLQDYLNENSVGDHSLAGLVQYGLHEGAFSTMGPNKLTGRADYYGTAINRAARVAAATEGGHVCMGICVVDEESDGDDDVLASAHKVLLTNQEICASLVGKRQLKGVQEKMAMYVCTRSPLT